MDTTENTQEAKEEDKFNLKCKYCFKNLSSRQNLKEHIFTHTGARPYVCQEPGCRQVFRQGSLLSIHKRIHSEIRKNELPKKISYAKIQFPSLTSLCGGKIYSFHEPIGADEKNEIKSKADVDFGFAMNYLKKIS